MVDDNEDEELAALRRKRMAALMAQKKQETDRQEMMEHATSMLDRKVDLAISYLFHPDAQAYFFQIKDRNPALHEQVKNILFPPEVILNVDLLLRRIQAGMVPRNVITLIDIQQIERELLGVKSTISYKKRGEDDRVDIGSLFKGD